jgi:hypothetical protein
MKEELEITVINGSSAPHIKNLYQRHNKEGIPYIELRKGKKYGEIWFETPCDMPFNPKPLFHLREWYESYWLQRKECKGLHPYRFSMGPTALWFKFTLNDFDVVKKQLTKLTWEHTTPNGRKLPAIKASSDRTFWKYVEKYFEKSREMKRKIGQKVIISDE